jgi:hypothetical protein
MYVPLWLCIPHFIGILISKRNATTSVSDSGAGPAKPNTARIVVTMGAVLQLVLRGSYEGSSAETP